MYRYLLSSRLTSRELPPIEDWTFLGLKRLERRPRTFVASQCQVEILVAFALASKCNVACFISQQEAYVGRQAIFQEHIVWM